MLTAIETLIHATAIEGFAMDRPILTQMANAAAAELGTTVAEIDRKYTEARNWKPQKENLRAILTTTLQRRTEAVTAEVMELQVRAYKLADELDIDLPQCDMPGTLAEMRDLCQRLNAQYEERQRASEYVTDFMMAHNAGGF